jgi:hypothetical protein
MMNPPESIKALRLLLKKIGGWDALHRASAADSEGILVFRPGSITQSGLIVNNGARS